MTTKGIKCLKCDDVIVSKYRHDFRRCKCGAAFVDGGRAYLRYGATSLSDVEVVDVEVPDGAE